MEVPPGPCAVYFSKECVPSLAFHTQYARNAQQTGVRLASSPLPVCWGAMSPYPSQTLTELHPPHSFVLCADRETEPWAA